MTDKNGHSINASVNPHLVEAVYAVRGKITEMAAKIEEQLKKDPDSLPFDSVVYCNIGNPQQLGQKPLTFARQMIAACECPELVADDRIKDAIPADVRERSTAVQAAMNVGAYTTSVGHAVIRQAVAEGISERDGHPADPDCIYLSNGASGSVHNIFKTLITDTKDAFLVPVPQYPLYSAALTLYGGTLLPYYLDEDTNWSVDCAEVESVIAKAQRDGLRVRGCVVINPGNPTGQVLDVDNQLVLLRVCAAAGVPIIADEVYQDNIWAEGKAFTSFRKVALDAGIPNAALYSLHSISKGFFGECGHRGGYLETMNIPEPITTQLKKLMSISLCSNTVGQILVSAMMRPPRPGDASHELYASQRADTLASLKRRAEKLAAAFQALDGISCTVPQGSLYVFPQLHLPDGAMRAAKEADVKPDFFYCARLVERAGVVAVPGSGFKQAEGTWHLRLTILPPEAEMDAVIERLKRFHSEFMDEFSS